QHRRVVELDPLVHLALLDRGVHQADHAQAVLLAGLHRGLHVIGQSLLEGHGALRCGWRGWWKCGGQKRKKPATLARAGFRRRRSGSVQALALGDVARHAACLALHRGRRLALALLGRLLVVLALAGLGEHAGLLAGALEATQGKLERLVFADFVAWHRNLGSWVTGRPTGLGRTLAFACAWSPDPASRV